MLKHYYPQNTNLPGSLRNSNIIKFLCVVKNQCYKLFHLLVTHLHNWLDRVITKTKNISSWHATNYNSNYISSPLSNLLITLDIYCKMRNSLDNCYRAYLDKCEIHKKLLLHSRYAKCDLCSLNGKYTFNTIRQLACYII